MSDFKIVGGINPKDETIINLEKVSKIVLDDDFVDIDEPMCVAIYGENGDIWNFETDLKELSDVLRCIEFSFNGRVDFTQKTADNTRGKLL